MSDHRPPAIDTSLRQQGPDTSQLREQRLHWDGIARAMPDLYEVYSTRYYRRCEITLISRLIGPLLGKKVLKLDLWNEAVNTRLLQWISEQGATAFGVDVSTVTTKRARKNDIDGDDCLHLAQSDIRHLPFPSDSFDVVYTMGTIEHMDDYDTAIREVCRVLKPGGLTIVGVPFKWDIFLRPIIVGILDWFGKYPYSPEKSFGSRELRSLLESSGLSPIQRSGILMLPGIIRMAEIFLYRRGLGIHRWLKPLVVPFDWLENRYRWPGYLGYLIAYSAEKPAVSEFGEPNDS
ncbi:MAG: class I SAM-dependent methyltransferase [Candidatus Latescibacteria bacterium]|nr:class I SAM-dependent methyltransferase [Candidatus Latescibacterota bacterium]